MPATIMFLAMTVAMPDGRRLHPDQACYAIRGPASDGAPVIGATWQSIVRDRVSNRPVWRIVVHQRLAGGRFDMRDALILDARTLRPVSLSTLRDGKPHAELAYAADRVTGYKIDRSGARIAIDQPLSLPVWEGDLYGPTFAALPLAPGASFSVPVYQYDRGLGAITVNVLGSERVDTPKGAVDAWLLDAGPDASERAQYLIAKKDGRELGYRSAQGGQTLGGDCAGLS